MKLSGNIIILYLAMLLPRSCLGNGCTQIIAAAPATPKVTAESQSISIDEAVALTSSVLPQVLGAAIDTTLLQVSGVVNGAVGLSEPPVITGENFQVVSTQLGNAQFILGSISGLSDTTGGQGVDFPTPIAFPVIPPP
jgi:hypothetical protein